MVILGLKPLSPVTLGTTVELGVGHQLVSPADPLHTRYGPFDHPLRLDVLVDGEVRAPDGTPTDIEGNAPPQSNRQRVYLVDMPAGRDPLWPSGFGIPAWALVDDCSAPMVPPTPTTTTVTAPASLAVTQSPDGQSVTVSIK